MTNPAPIEPFNGKPANSLQGTDISPAQAYQMTLDEQIDEILVDSVGMDFCENKACSHYEQYLLAKQSIHALIADQVREAYRKGYNDNARDCYCDSTKVIESLIPHKHLMDDGKSHNIRPDLPKGDDK